MHHAPAPFSPALLNAMQPPSAPAAAPDTPGAPAPAAPPPLAPSDRIRELALTSLEHIDDGFATLNDAEIKPVERSRMLNTNIANLQRMHALLKSIEPKKDTHAHVDPAHAPLDADEFYDAHAASEPGDNTDADESDPLFLALLERLDQALRPFPETSDPQPGPCDLPR